jgi:hypothetical protein
LVDLKNEWTESLEMNYGDAPDIDEKSIVEFEIRNKN